MSKINHPRHGSLQFWPRRRSRHSIARVRSWANESKVKPLGFIGYKAGMTHLQVVDNYVKSMTKGETITIPSTIIECPPMVVAGAAFYVSSSNGLRKSISFFAPKVDPILQRKIQLPKKQIKSFNDVPEFSDLRLLVYSVPEKAGTGTKRPKLTEVALGGTKEEKLQYAQEILGKEIKVTDVFQAGNSLDIRGITKGKGFQGTVKRFGVPIRQHKAEKTKRGIGTLGPWHPRRVMFTVAQSGKMGFHSRMEYNKQLIKIGENGQEVTPSGGVNKYGLVRNTYLLIKGSVVGPKKRAVFLTPSQRPSYKIPKEAPEVVYTSLRP